MNIAHGPFVGPLALAPRARGYCTERQGTERWCIHTATMQLTHLHAKRAKRAFCTIGLLYSICTNLFAAFLLQ